MTIGNGKSLGELEQLVMEFLWAHGPSTGEAVRAGLGKDRVLTDSTIRTVLRRLEAKQFVRHEMDGRQFLYSSAREPRKVAAEAVRSALKNFCRGSLEELLTGLVDHRVVDSAELRRLAEKIEVQEKEEEVMSLEALGIALLTASLVRPFALAGVAWLVLWVFRVRHPASRHAVWTAVLAGMLILPFVSVFAPHWKLPVLPAQRVAATTPATLAAVSRSLSYEDPEIADAGQKPGGRAWNPGAKALAPRWPSIQTLIIWIYVAGLLAMVSYRVVGRVLLWRVMARSRPLRARWLRESADVLTPVAVGVLRPVVILPFGWREWNCDTRRAVLAHEFAHLRRHDAAVSGLGWWVRCLFWFHPLAWWVSRKVSDLAELACDASALERVADPAGYSRMLLGFADIVNRAGNRVALPALAIASAARMDRRIEQVFEYSGGTRRKLTRPALVLAITGVPVICFAATVGLGERVILLPRNATVLRMDPPTPVASSTVASIAPVIVAQQSAAPALAAQSIAPAKAPARPEFEVASIKLSQGCTPMGGGRGGRGGGSPTRPVMSSPGRLNISCQSVVELIQMAYGRYASGAFQYGRIVPIEGAPAWTQSDRYTIEAKGDVAQKEGMMMGPMMQALLEDRFQLKIRRESREVPVYELSVANGGPRLEPFHEGSCDATEVAVAERDPEVNYCSTWSSSMRRSSPNLTVHRQKLSLDDFSRTIDVDRPVINKTNITGLFNFTLEYAQEGNSDEAIRLRAETAATPELREQMLAVVTARADGPPAISIFTALQQQLGLKLEKAVGPGEVLVIDHVEKPSEN